MSDSGFGRFLRGGLRTGMRATGGTAIQDLLGALAGFSESGSFPEAGPDGTLLFRSRNEQASPRALGNSIIAGPDASPTDLEHELRHVNQSRSLGPTYLPLSLLGGDLGVLEDDAFDATEEPGSVALSNRAQFQKAAGESRNPMLQGLIRLLTGDK